MLKPLNGFVLVKPDEAQTKTKSGLTLPDSAQYEVCTGTVEEACEFYFVGSQKYDCQIKKGDKVVYRRYSGFEFRGKLIIQIGELVATDN